MSSERFLIEEYKKLHRQIEDFESHEQSREDRKTIAMLRQTLIGVWNKLPPKQQKEIACTYIPET